MWIGEISKSHAILEERRYLAVFSDGKVHLRHPALALQTNEQKDMRKGIEAFYQSKPKQQTLSSAFLHQVLPSKYPFKFIEHYDSSLQIPGARFCRR